MIEKSDQSNSFIHRILYAKLIDVNSISKNIDGSYQVQFKTGKSWSTIDFVRGSFKFEEPTDNSNPGIVYKQKIELAIPADDILQNELITDLADSHLILVMQFSQYAKFIGSLENPCQLLSEINAEDYATQRKVTITRLSNTPSKFIII